MSRIYDSYHDWKNPILCIKKQKRLIAGSRNINFLPDRLSSKISQFFVDLKFQSILDYGAGMGRNFKLLKNYSQKVDYVDIDVYKNHTSHLGYDNKFYIKNHVLDNFSYKYDLIYASVVIQHFANKEVFDSAVNFLQQNGKYVFIVQNTCVPFSPILDSKFTLLHSETYKGVFAVNHVFNLYESKRD